MTYEDFTWSTDRANTFGSRNTGQTFSTLYPFINEIHYDNASTDTGEFIELAGAAGTDFTNSGWSIVRYNGSNGTVYNSPDADPLGSDVLSGMIPDLGGGFGVVSVNYLSNGLQNGSPDGCGSTFNFDPGSARRQTHRKRPQTLAVVAFSGLEVGHDWAPIRPPGGSLLLADSQAGLQKALHDPTHLCRVGPPGRLAPRILGGAHGALVSQDDLRGVRKVPAGAEERPREDPEVLRQ